MKPKHNIAGLVLLLTLLVSWAAGWSQDGQSKSVNSAKSSVTPIPVVPFIIEYEYGEKYFVQKINDNPHYAGIEALLKEGSSPVYQLLMTETEGRRKVYYTNSEARAKALELMGKLVRVTPIEYKIEKSLGEQPKHFIAFKDAKDRLIQWTFIPVSEMDEESKGVSLIGRPLKILHRVMASMAGEGTVVQIDNTTVAAKEMPELSTPPIIIVYEGTLCVDATIGSLVSGSQTWQVKTLPPLIDVGAEWEFTDERGNERKFKVTAKNKNDVTIQEARTDPSVSSLMTLNMKEDPDGLSLSSMAFSEGTRAFRLTFVPELNIAGVLLSGKKASISFQLDIGGESKAVEGVMEVERKGDLVELIGRPSAPEWATKLILKSQITLSRTGYKIESEKVSPVN